MIEILITIILSVSSTLYFIIEPEKTECYPCEEIIINETVEEQPITVKKENLMMKSAVVHYKNKYPGSQVHTSENSLNVFSQDGQHLICVEKNGHGQPVDRSAELGLPERHDMSPIPKESRVHKLYANGMIGKSEEFEERSAFVAEKVKKCKNGYKKIQGKNFNGQCVLDESIFEEEEEKKEIAQAASPAKKKAKKA